MTNHMKEIANMLGVELGEEFEVEFPNDSKSYTKAILQDFGLKIISSNIAGPQPWNVYCLQNLLKGYLSIKKKPWKPTYNEKYYSIGPGGVLEPGNWMNDFIDQAMYKLGNCYRTSREAEVNRDKWIKFYASDEIIEM